MQSARRLEDISDGKIYDIEDMVKADTDGCNGCSACCHNVGDLVVLTPFDAYEIRSYFNVDFDALIDVKFTLRTENKITLPYLKMEEETLRCTFLNEQDRCSIHGYRPNICRLFPLGRIYENQDFKYFLQVNSCLKPQLKSVQVKDWIGIDHYEMNKAFILAWHDFIKALTFRLKFTRDVAEINAMNHYVLDTFYRMPLAVHQDFYTVFNEKLPQAKQYLGIL